MHRVSLRSAAIAAVCFALVASCSLQEAGNRADSTTVVAKTATKSWSPDTWQPPVVDSTPDEIRSRSRSIEASRFLRTRTTVFLVMRAVR